METRKYNKEDYSILESWWKDYGYPSIPESILSDYGIIVHDNEQPIAFTCAYLDKTKPFAFLAFTIVNKNIEGFKKYKGLKLVVSEMKKQLKEEGYQAVYCVTSNETLITLYGSEGFQVSEKNATSLIMPLSDERVDYLT